ncbi:MAG: histone deacetylase family protein [Elusimicrobiota bacterium]
MSEKKAVYSSKYEIDIGAHVFPTFKYRLVKERLVEAGLYSEDDFIEPSPARISQLVKVHDSKYVDKISNGTLSPADELRLELPFSKPLADASFLCAGGSLLASEIALKQKFCVHIGGGFHHAYPDHGEGFCVFNDVALGAHEISRGNMKVLIVDCDLHQGNGTAVFFKNNSDVFTFSMHQENNYPIYKEKSDMDVALEDGIEGNKYNKILEKSLAEIEKKFSADFIFYVAGADPYRGDQLGGLDLSIEDLKKRDELVKSFSRRHDIPAVAVFAGGYAPEIEDIVDIHFNTAEVFTC